MAQNLDFLAVGDITTDAFIALKDASVNCEINRDTCMLCMRFGDKIPYESVDIISAVGNSPNAAVSAQRLGLASALATNLGDDRNGVDCLDALKKEGIDSTYVTVHPGKETNYHYVLRYETERTILVKHHEYPYALPSFDSAPRWIYLSSLGEKSLDYQESIATYVKENPEVKLAFQPGTFQIKLGFEGLGNVYKASELLFCNKEEARKLLDTHTDDIVELLKGLHERGPKIVVITDGPKGAHTYDGSEVWFMPMYPDPKPPVERTGAGDAFSSTFTAALALGHDIPTALTWGPINSMSVVQYVGAQKGLLSREELEKYLADAPPEYKAQKIA